MHLLCIQQSTSYVKLTTIIIMELSRKLYTEKPLMWLQYVIFSVISWVLVWTTFTRIVQKRKISSLLVWIHLICIQQSTSYMAFFVVRNLLSRKCSTEKLIIWSISYQFLIHAVDNHKESIMTKDCYWETYNVINWFNIYDLCQALVNIVPTAWMQWMV